MGGISKSARKMSQQRSIAADIADGVNSSKASGFNLSLGIEGEEKMTDAVPERCWEDLLHFQRGSSFLPQYYTELT